MDREEAKKRVGNAAAERVEDGQRLGLGSGSTVARFLDALAARRNEEALDVVGVPTSEETAEHARKLDIPLTTLAESPRLDLCIDGADEVSPELDLIKGGGGALFREKVVASVSREVLIIVDATKEVDRLGATFDLPVEVAEYARPVVEDRLQDLSPTLREEHGDPFVTDNGNRILDLATGPIEDPEGLAQRLQTTPGVIEHGLFLGMADACLVAGQSRVTAKHAARA